MKACRASQGTSRHHSDSIAVVHAMISSCCNWHSRNAASLGEVATVLGNTAMYLRRVSEVNEVFDKKMLPICWTLLPDADGTQYQG